LELTSSEATMTTKLPDDLRADVEAALPCALPEVCSGYPNHLGDCVARKRPAVEALLAGERELYHDMARQLDREIIAHRATTAERDALRRELAEAREETLRRAARMVCQGCRAAPPTRLPSGLWWHVRTAKDMTHCPAEAIHDAIRAITPKEPPMASEPSTAQDTNEYIAERRSRDGAGQHRAA
jgi:hypothetical protein